MPQLDLLTLSVQVSAIIFFSWGLLITMLNLILPQYLVLNHSKKLLWFYLNNLIVKVKYYAFLTYAHGVVAFDSFVKSLLQKVNLLKTLIGNFTKLVFKRLRKRKILFAFLKVFFFEKLFFLNDNSIKKNSINTFGQKYKLNFFFKKNSTYTFVQKYLLNFSNKFNLTKRKRLTIMLKEGLHAWTFEDRARVKNVKQVVLNTTPIFKL